MKTNIEFNQTELLQEERIMLYLQGKMTTDEEKLFMDELNENPELKEKAISIARLAKGLSQVGEERDKILKEAFLSTNESVIRKLAENAHKKSNVIAFKRHYATILSLAASLIFAVYLGFQYRDYQRTTSLGNQYAMQYDTSIMRGDSQPEIEKEVSELIGNVYSNQNLNETLKRLAVLWEVSTMETYNDYTDFAPEIGWALATGYLKDNNKTDAIEVLLKMETLYDADTDLGVRVRNLHEKIKGL